MSDEEQGKKQDKKRQEGFRALFLVLHWAFKTYIVFLTLLLWLPDPRSLFFGWQPKGGPAGFEHIITFSILGFLAEAGRQRYSFFFWATALFGYTLMTEIVQEMLPIRSFDLFDIMQDLAGLYVGFWAAAVVKRFCCGITRYQELSID